MILPHSRGILHPVSWTGEQGHHKAFPCLETKGLIPHLTREQVHYFAKSCFLPPSKSILASTHMQDCQNQEVSQEIIMVQTQFQFNNFAGEKKQNKTKKRQTLQHKACQSQYIRSMCVQQKSSQGGNPELMLQYSMTLLGTSAAWVLGDLLFLFSKQRESFHHHPVCASQISLSRLAYRPIVILFCTKILHCLLPPLQMAADMTTPRPQMLFTTCDGQPHA